MGNLSATLLVNRVGARRLVIFSFSMMVVGVGLTSAATSLSALFVAQFFIGLSHGINFPALMGLSICYVADSERNTAMGLHQSVYAVGMFGGPWLSGILAQAIGLRSMLFTTALARSSSVCWVLQNWMRKLPVRFSKSVFVVNANFLRKTSPDFCYMIWLERKTG